MTNHNGVNYQPILYRVWGPGQDPQTLDATITLHGTQGMRFFAYAVACKGSTFLDKVFAIQAWQMAPDGQWEMVANGTFMIMSLPLGLRTFHEWGQQAPGTTQGIISVMLSAALAAREVAV